jgi:uncharacterized protein (DUF1501 family)
MPRDASAAAGEPRLLIVLLRGGMDGLHVVLPRNDPNYVRHRKSIAHDPELYPQLSSEFALHSDMSNFFSMYQAGHGAIVHAVAPPLRNRSHFECQYNLEAGVPGGVLRMTSTGWINRLFAALPKDNTLLLRNALEVGQAPLITAGPEPVLSWQPLSWPRPSHFDENLLALYKNTDRSFHALLERGIGTNAFARGPVTTTDAPPNPLQLAFQGAGRLLSADAGPRIAVLAVDGWDTHGEQNTALPRVFKLLDASLEDFRLAVGEAWNRTVVVCVTEFGRTVAVNGSLGTDHGMGTVSFLAGGAVNGGKLHGEWPGIAKLAEWGDLPATTDMRQLFKGILLDHMGVAPAILDKQVFPESAGVKPMRDLVKPASMAAAAPNAARMAVAAKSPAPAISSSIARYRAANPSP